MDIFPLLQGPKSVIKSELFPSDWSNTNLKSENGLKMPKSVHGRYISVIKSNPNPNPKPQS